MRDSGQGVSAAPGDPGSGSGTGFEALARQYWNAWGDALRSASPGAAQACTQPWQAALDRWSRAAQGGRLDGLRSGSAAARESWVWSVEICVETDQYKKQ